MEELVAELQNEAATTKRILERVPDEKLTWKPHPKSMSLGQLAMHIASIPGNISRLAQADEFDAATANFTPPEPQSTAEILKILEEGVASASGYIQSLAPESARATWRLKANGREVFSLPRAGVLRNILLNHWYHHRGQLSVYLRLLDIPVPVIYGRSADENPFA